jgi:hypothetical protein
MKFRQLIAKYVSGNLTSSQLPTIGIKGLEERIDSPSLIILAGLNKNENPSEVNYYFNQALRELEIELPNRRQAAIEYALAIVDEIISEKRDIIDGIKEIVNKAIASYDFYSETDKYVYDSIHFEKAYSLYDTFDDLSNADIPWQKEKTNQQLVTEVKEELFHELKEWKAKINGA